MNSRNKLKDQVELPRWTVTAFYRTANGLLDVEHHIEELEELQAMIERGPDWYTLDRIEIRLTDQTAPKVLAAQSVAQ